MANNTPTGIHHLAERFTTARHAEFGPVPIWWWSGDTVTRERLRWQMQQLTSQGVAQAVIMNLAPSGPLYGALADDPAFMSEAWWELFLGACSDAHELGFRFWPYDQIGFSGANFQGRLVTGHPEWAGQTLGRATALLESTEPHTVIVPQNARALAAYAVTSDRTTAVTVPLDGDRATFSGSPGDTLTIVYAQEHGFDYFNTTAVAALIDTVHGEFARRASDWFGSVIVGFFQDELPSMPTWGSGFAARFESEFGYDITGALGALWGDPVADASRAPSPDRARLDYQRLRATLSREGFFDQLDAWFETNGLQCGFDQQSPAREGDPAGSVGVYADYLKTHSGFSAPGSDHLGDPKVHSSLSHLSGGSRTWIEAFHSSGWGGTLEETYDWLAPFLKRGATLYDPHAVYYSTPGGWWEWAPPSTCWRQPYWPEYHVLSDSVTRLSETLSRGKLVADTALVFPTATVQAGFTFEGAMDDASRATRIYHSLNGETAWSSEKPGVLDRAAHEYEIVDDARLGSALVENGMLRVGPAQFSNVILPAVTVLDDAAADVLARFAAVGGTVVCVGTVPQMFAGTGEGAGTGASRFRAAVASGAIVVVERADDVIDELVRQAAWVETDVPSLLRTVGDGYVLALFAHDDITGTEQPIYKGEEGYLDWIEVGWSSFWEGLRETGYTFNPVGARSSRVTVHGAGSLRGVGPLRAQRWNPVTGERTALNAHVAADGSVSLEVDFRDGSVALVVLGCELPEPDGVAAVRAGAGGVRAAGARAAGVRAAGASQEAPGQFEGAERVTVGGWQIAAASTLDNRWGDFASRSRPGVLPIEVWSFETTEGDSVDEGSVWRPATATFGPFAEIAGPDASADLPESAWSPAEWSLSRGIRNDGMHQDNLGPKGYVPEEFLSWKDVEAGDVVAVRTWIDVPAAVQAGGHRLVVGANAVPRVELDGFALDSANGGYWSSATVPPGRHRLQIAFEATASEPVRASFALVDEASADAYQRAEWLATTDAAVAASVVTVSTTFDLRGMPDDGRIQVGAEQPCTVVINGVEVGRQNAFHPYGGHREARFHPYDLSPHLRVGANTLELRSVDSDRPVAVVVDSVPSGFGGLGILSSDTSGDIEWLATRDGRAVDLQPRAQQWGDPRLLSIVARPHPLPRASWLERPAYTEGVVVDLVPDLDPDDVATRWLRCLLPIGTTSIEVPTDLAFDASIDGVAVDVSSDGRTLRLVDASSFGATLLLAFTPTDGRRGGALLDEPLRVTTTRVAAPLADWTQLGLGALAGEVSYRSLLPAVTRDAGQPVWLDLGSVRGSVQVLIDDEPVASLAWGPYAVDITEHYRSGATLEVRVHNTLAGYLDVASPTPGVFPGQKVAGLFGPVGVTVG